MHRDTLEDYGMDQFTRVCTLRPTLPATRCLAENLGRERLGLTRSFFCIHNRTHCTRPNEP
jgi:hypothetical protein